MIRVLKLTFISLLKSALGFGKVIKEERGQRKIAVPEGNVGTGRETSVVELYELCARVAGSDAEAEQVPARLGELQRSFLDPELAARELGFTAMVELEDGLRATWEWIQKE